MQYSMGRHVSWYKQCTHDQEGSKKEKLILNNALQLELLWRPGMHVPVIFSMQRSACCHIQGSIRVNWDKRHHKNYHRARFRVRLGLGLGYLILHG